MKNTKICVMPHTHWDREWYFDITKSTIYLVHTMKEIISYLNENEDFKYFLLDAQVSLIDDYLKICPEDEEDIKKLVKNGRLITGPWYTQTDLLVISGESIVRNLYYGISGAEKLGKSMMVGYVPDCFGQSAQMPQIYNGFGIDKCVFRRGKSESRIDKAEFYWTGPSGSKVFTHNIVDYGNMINPPKKSVEIKEYFNEKIDELGVLTDTNCILLTNGQDQRPIRKDLLEILEDAKVQGFDIEIKNLEETLEYMEKSAHFKTFSGEFTFGQKSRVHKSIFSTRADLKIMNNKLENKITNIVEPLATIAYSLGFPYYHKILEEIWKLMFDNAAHDSIGMCNSDDVNDYIENRYKKANALCDNYCDLIGRLIGQKIEEKNAFQFQIYNFLPYKRDGYIKAELFTPCKNFKILDSDGNICLHELIEISDFTNKIYENSAKEIGVNGDYSPKWFAENTKIYKATVYMHTTDIPSMGYKTFFISEDDKKIEQNINLDHIIENEHLKVSLNDSIDVLYKEKNILFEKFMQIEDMGDDGDTYDYSVPRVDKRILSDFSNKRNVKVYKNELYQSISFDFDMLLPYDLTKRAESVLDIKNTINIELKLYKNSKLLNVNIKVDNKCIEHRLRAVFNTCINSSYSIADMQFGTIKRENYIKEVENWEENGFVEKPRNIEPMQSFVSIKNDDLGVCVFTDCVREYQVLDDKSLALTMFRSVAFMGKADLLDRPGRASGMEWETPNACLLKEIKSNYSVLFYENYSENELCKISKELFTPLTLIQASKFKNNFEYFILNAQEDIDLTEKYSLLEFKENNAVLSTFKKAENEDAFIVRMFNGNICSEIIEEPTIDATINSNIVNLLENPIQNVKDTKITLKGSQFITLKMD